LEEVFRNFFNNNLNEISREDLEEDYNSSEPWEYWLKIYEKQGICEYKGRQIRLRPASMNFLITMYRHKEDIISVQEFKELYTIEANSVYKAKERVNEDFNKGLASSDEKVILIDKNPKYGYFITIPKTRILII